MDELPVEKLAPSQVIEVKDSVAYVQQGDGCTASTQPGAIIEFAEGAIGVLAAWKEEVGAVVLVDGEASPGERAKKTPGEMTTQVNDRLGRVLYPNGQPADGDDPPAGEAESRSTFQESKGMKERDSDYTPCHTGILGVDFAVPVGRGQTMLFQGTDRKRDLEHLWPDLMSARSGPLAAKSGTASICVCETLETAAVLRARLLDSGTWESSIIVIPDVPGDGGVTLAIKGAVTLAEALHDQNYDVKVLFGLEPMHKLWNSLAEVCGAERRRQGLEEVEDKLEEVDGTLMQSSIAERRKYWFRLTNRAINSLGSGSITFLAWAFEQEGGRPVRQQKAFQQQVEKIKKIARISDSVRERMLAKVHADARAAGVPLDQTVVAPGNDVPGMPNWEIEELKSITDGHILLRKPEGEQYRWIVNLYESIPRLGTDALHPALLSVGAHRLRLRMLQAKDRAKHLHDTLGPAGTLDAPALELTFADLLGEQRSSEPMHVSEQVARMVIINEADCRPLREPGCCTSDTLAALAVRLLESEVGQRISEDIAERGQVMPATQVLLGEEIRGWQAA
uniref:Uncharacterized protein n=1 Tax=Zooxanthella nutricula TaxID=1333877 RepID=A0A7S2PXG7_9DINO